MYTYTYMYIYTHMHMYGHMYMCMLLRIRICTCMCCWHTRTAQICLEHSLMPTNGSLLAHSDGVDVHSYVMYIIHTYIDHTHIHICIHTHMYEPSVRPPVSEKSSPRGRGHSGDTVSSHSFNSQSRKSRVSNPRTAACAHS